MEIDITAFFKNSDPWQFSASKAEIGQNAGSITWNNAKQEASESPLLTTEEQLQALRDHVQGMGLAKRCSNTAQMNAMRYLFSSYQGI